MKKAILKKGIIIFCAAAGLFAVGCGNKIIQTLDSVAESIEKWGSISVSAPVLIPIEQDKNTFSFDLENDAKFYYNASRTEGLVKAMTQESVNVQLAVSVLAEELSQTVGAMNTAETKDQKNASQERLTRLSLMLGALSNLSALSPNAQQDPAFAAGIDMLANLVEAWAKARSTQAAAAQTAATKNTGAAAKAAKADNATVDDVFKNLAQAVLSSKQFSPASTDDNTTSITISPRQALMLAANDKMTQDLLKWFAKPKADAKTKLFYCMMTVSCQPGYKTRNGYAGDVMVLTEYAKKDTKAEELFIYSCTEKNNLKYFCQRPAVTAVYPMVDAQVLDVRSRLRQQMALSTALAMQGYGSQAKLIADYVKRIEEDARTMTAFTVGSAYSIGGYNFGFRIEPRFMALNKAGAKERSSDFRLESTEFPAMVIVAIDDEDFKNYDHIAFYIESRWLPLKDTAWWKLFSSPKGLSEKEIIRRAQGLDSLDGLTLDTEKTTQDEGLFGWMTAMLSSVVSGPGDETGKTKLVDATLKRRKMAMGAAGLGASIVVPIPQTGGS